MENLISLGVFPGSVCFDKLLVNGEKFCGGFKDSFTPGDANFDAALSLPHSVSIDVSAINSVDFQFTSDGSINFSGFLAQWKLEAAEATIVG